MSTPIQNHGDKQHSKQCIPIQPLNFPLYFNSFSLMNMLVTYSL